MSKMRIHNTTAFFLDKATAGGPFKQERSDAHSQSGAGRGIYFCKIRAVGKIFNRKRGKKRVRKALPVFSILRDTNGSQPVINLR